MSVNLLNAIAGQGAAWQDVLNSDQAGLDWASEEDFKTAVRTLVLNHDPKTRLTPHHLVKELHKIGNRRVREAGEPRIEPADTGRWPKFLQKRAYLLKCGFGVEEAERRARQALKLSPAPKRPPVTTQAESRQQLNKLITGLAASKRTTPPEAQKPL